MKSAIEECTNCNARINSCVPECPWCGVPREPMPAGPVVKRWSLGALIMILTIAAVLLWLMSLDRMTKATGILLESIPIEDVGVVWPP